MSMFDIKKARRRSAYLMLSETSQQALVQTNAQQDNYHYGNTPTLTPAEFPSIGSLEW